MDKGTMDKGPSAFRTISEVAQELALPQHVLRFWETRFTQIKPLKRGGGRRYYRPDDVELLRSIRHLLYADGYTIKGVQRLLREHGARAVAAAATGSELEPAIARRALDEGHEPSRASPTPPPDVQSGDARSEAAGNELEMLFDERAHPVPVAVPGKPATPPPDREKLRAVLADLAECGRLLAAARAI